MTLVHQVPIERLQTTLAVLRGRRTDRHSEVGAAEEARDRLTLGAARHHELRACLEGGAQFFIDARAILETLYLLYREALLYSFDSLKRFASP